MRPGGFRWIAHHSISAFILAKSLLYAVKQPVQRYTVHIPLPSTLILLTCKKNIRNLNSNDTSAVFFFFRCAEIVSVLPVGSLTMR